MFFFLIPSLPPSSSKKPTRLSTKTNTALLRNNVCFDTYNNGGAAIYFFCTASYMLAKTPIPAPMSKP